MELTSMHKSTLIFMALIFLIIILGMWLKQDISKPKQIIKIEQPLELEL